MLAGEKLTAEQMCAREKLTAEEMHAGEKLTMEEMRAGEQLTAKEICSESAFSAFYFLPPRFSAGLRTFPRARAHFRGQMAL